ncbi:MAG TPA: hypothetical protein VGH90_05570 [Chthoniobacteraceae bacterium]
MSNRFASPRELIVENSPPHAVREPSTVKEAFTAVGETVEKAERRQAVIICHGMGQQVPFETLDLAADTLFRWKFAKAPATVGYRQFGETALPRATLEVPREKGAEALVDFFEVYWAPVTEGQVGLLDTLKFLLHGGVSGISQSLNAFERFLFGKFRSFALPRGTLVKLSGVCFVLATALLSFLNFLGFTVYALIYSFDYTLLLNAILFSLLPPIVVGVAAWWLVKRANKRHEPGNFSRPAQLSLPKWFGLCYIAVLFAVTAWIDWELILRYMDETRGLDLDVLGRVLIILGWLGCVAIFLGLRWFLIQYAGDVAAYVSAYNLNRFTKVREEIQRRALEVFCAVYGARDSANGFTYDKVIVTGHSLGSLVAYDGLNAMILGDRVGRTQLSAAARTKGLLTFGSPLDKTAFLFRMQTDAVIREGLAEAAQPLIHEQRPFPWINIYSPADIISGSLEFYDAPDEAQAHPVQNVWDMDADTPLVAHVQYWKNKCLAEKLRDLILDEGLAEG